MCSGDPVDPSDPAPSGESVRRTDPAESKVRRWNAYPGAQAPDRRRAVDSFGLTLAVKEWGPEDGQLLLLAHGGADFAETFSVFAPLLAAHGFRVVSWDHRSHGDSEPAALMSWEADCRDAFMVLESCCPDGSPVQKAVAVGHSKGGGLMSELCAAFPDRFHCLVNIDGIPSRLRRRTPAGLSLEQRVDRRDQWMAQHLDWRGRTHDSERKPGTPEDLVQRRARHNPRLSEEWLQFLVTVGARQDGDGWRWKLDPLVRMFQPGPWRPDWGIATLRSVTVPVQAIVGRVQEPMGWGTSPDEARRNLPDHAGLEVFDDSGHFVHIEHPQRAADVVLEFLDRVPGR